MNQTAGKAARSIGLQLFVLSFASLFLELMLIRWVPAVVRLVAYYANLMLISSFLGLGLGAMLASRVRTLFGWFPLVLLINGGVLLILSRAEFVAGSASEARFFISPSQLHNYLILLTVFFLNVLIFVPLGQRVGLLFRELPPLRAYAWDLGGSLSGTLCFGAFSLLHFSPVIGFTVVMAIIIWLSTKSQRIAAILATPILLIATAASTSASAVWSPYYYITVAAANANQFEVDHPPPRLRTMMNPPIFIMRVGRDFYQMHGALDTTRYTEANSTGLFARMKRQQYVLPYQLANRHDRVAVMGAGGGMDVEAGLLSGASHIDAVEIDPILVANSRKYNASDPFGDPRVSVHIDDARAFINRMPDERDMVVFGFLDSQALFSAMANVRLDGYIYTVESMRTAFSKLAPGGMLSLSFAIPTPWMAGKLTNMLTAATGHTPIIYFNDDAVVMCVYNGEPPDRLPERYGSWTRVAPPKTSAAVPTDNWPFLYLERHTVPFDYVVVIGGLLIASIVAVGSVRGLKVQTGDAHFFFLGLAFLLLQTKSITDCSLYFGATWLVTTIVVAGVLLMVLAANLIAMRLAKFRIWFYLPLLASLLLLYFTPRGAILAQALPVRLIWAILVVPLPIFFAGLIFSTTFRNSADPAAAFGANLIGATVGGFTEYLGMAVGLHALSLFVMAAYLASFLTQRRDTARFHKI